LAYKLTNSLPQSSILFSYLSLQKNYDMLLKNTFVHHVHFWLKDKADRQKLIEGLYSLSPITHIRDIHIGVAAETFREVIDRSYDASLLLLFDTPEAQEAYQGDPIHLLFVENYAKPLCARVLVLDNVNVF
jgi:hypothetical protein